MSNAAFEKILENEKKHGDIKLVKTEKRRNHLVSEPNYHTTKFFTDNLLAIEIKNSNINKQACLFRIINIRYKQTCNV